MKKLLTLLGLFIILPFNVASAEGLNEKPEIVSESAILMDTQSGAVLFEKSSDKRMVPASLTKIATAIYAIEKGNLEDTFNVMKEATDVEGTRVYLEEGEVVTLEHLIQGMLVNSGNDAAAAIAIHLDGSIDKFSVNLNRYLKETIGVENTNFTNPHGLYDEKHYTTAHDLAVITNYAMKNPVFKQIFGTKELVWDGMSWDTTLFTHHLLLKGDYPYEGITGGKTGFVNEAKQTLATTAENENIQLTAIVLKANYKREIYHDTQLLLNYGFQSFKSDLIDRSKVYWSGEKKYRVEDAVKITAPISGYEESVTSEGMLEITNSTGEIIQSVVLEEEKANLTVKTAENIGELDNKSNTVGQNTLFIIAIFALTSLLFGAKKWNRRL